MKKIVTSVLLFLVLSIVMCGCGKSVKTQELSENIEAYKKIAEIAIKDFQDEEHKEGTRWFADMSEFSEYDDTTSFGLYSDKDLSKIKSLGIKYVDTRDKLVRKDLTKIKVSKISYIILIVMLVLSLITLFL